MVNMPATGNVSERQPGPLLVVDDGHVDQQSTRSAVGGELQLVPNKVYGDVTRRDDLVREPEPAF
jgi:hypothetical protein